MSAGVFIGGCCPLHPGEILRGWQPLHPPVGLPGPHPGFLSFHDERNQRRARGCAPWTPLGGIIIPPAARTPQRGVAASPQKDSPRGRVGGGAGLCFPPRRIRGRAIKGRVITKPSLYLKTNSCNEGQNFSLYIPFYKIFFYKSWLLSLQKGCFLASLSHFWLQPSLQRTCNEHRIFCKLYE